MMSSPVLLNGYVLVIVINAVGKINNIVGDQKKRVTPTLYMFYSYKLSSVDSFLLMSQF